VPGDPAGLAGDVGAATDAGEAVVLRPSGGLLVPTVAESSGARAVRWDLREGAEPASAALGSPGLAEADRGLREALLASAADLEALGVDRPRSDVAGRLARVERRLADQDLPPLPQRAVVLIRTAGRLLAAVAMAGEDEGGALTAGEAARRREVLAPVARACRRALEAAYGAGGEDAADSVARPWTSREPSSSP
jgi:hypothetical protein